MLGLHYCSAEGRQKLVSMFLTIITTLWYIGFMAIRSVQPLKHLLKSVAVTIIALGIAGLGTLTAGQITCGPECSRHAPALHQPSCCEPPAGTSHVKKIVTCDLQETRQAPSSACSGTLCTDFSPDVREIAAYVSTSMDMSGTLRNACSSETADFHIPQRSFGQPHAPVKKIPIHMLTCVYLI